MLRKARCSSAVTEEAFTIDEKALVDDARLLRFSHFSRSVSYWRLRVDREGAEEDALDDLDDRELFLSQSFANR